MLRIGVTEREDAGLDFSWIDKLYEANIIISKNMNDELIKNLINNKSRVIAHVTCTNYGGTILEPNVPNLNYTYFQVRKLIQQGFPKEQIVLRVDPVIPTPKGIERALEVLSYFKMTGIKRVRFSFLDLHPHVKERFEAEDIPLPYDTFTAPKHMRDDFLNKLESYKDSYEFESCAEDTQYQLGCISQKDIDILGIKEKLSVGGFQRKGCLCANRKTELLKSKIRCQHGCIYCFWKD